MSADRITQFFLLDRIIHEFSTHLKPDRPNIMRSIGAQESRELGGAFRFCAHVT